MSLPRHRRHVQHLTSVQPHCIGVGCPERGQSGRAGRESNTMVEDPETLTVRYFAPPEHTAHRDPRHGFWTIGYLPDRHLTSGQAHAAVSIADALSNNSPWLHACIPAWAEQLGMSIHDAYTVFGNAVPAARRWAAAMQVVAR